jgi:FkbM family methyltransferase
MATESEASSKLDRRMSRIEFSDFLPPIIPRVLKHFSRKKLPKARNDKPVRQHPFDAIPECIEATWILDIGANIGDVSIAALNSFPNSNVICFEPVKETFERLSARLNQYRSRVFLFNYALSDREGEAEINITTFHGANSLISQSKYHKVLNPGVREISKQKVLMARLDDFSSKFPSQKIDILKLDVEGYELNVLKGGYRFISENVDTIIVEIAPMRDTSWEEQALFEIFALLNRSGFRLINITDIHSVRGKNLCLAQMDCVFRNKRYLVSD